MSNIKRIMGIFPVMLIIIFVLTLGIFEAFLQSLGYFPASKMYDISFRYYIELLSNKDFLSSLNYTVYITFLSSIISVILGIILAKIFIKSDFKSEFIYKIPIIIPHIIVALFAIIFLSDTGLISRIMYNMGFKNSQNFFSNLLFNKNGVGIMISYVYKQTPYVLLCALSVLKRISKKHELAAINLGASKFYAFKKITIPMLLPTITSTFTIIFAFSFGSYEIPMLLGSTYPKALSVLAFIEYQNPIMKNRVYAMAMNIIIIFFCTVFTLFFNYVIKRIVLGENYKNE